MQEGGGQLGFCGVARPEDLKVEVSGKEGGRRGPAPRAGNQFIEDANAVVRREVNG